MSERNIHGQLTQVDENGDVTVLHPYINASDDIVEGVLPIERGGTGASTSDELKRTIKNTIGFASSNNAGIMTASDKQKLDEISTKSLYSIPYCKAGQPAAGIYHATGDTIEFVDGVQLILDSSSGMTIGPTLGYMGSKLAVKDSSENWNEKIIMYNGTKSVDMSDSEPLKLKKGKYLFKYSSYYDVVELIGRIPEPVETTDIMGGANQYSSGEAGLVPAPAKNQHTYFLRGDGKWAEVVDNNGNIVATPNVDSATGTLDIEHGGTGTTTLEGIKELVGTNYSNPSIVDTLKSTLGINYYKKVGDDATVNEVDLNNYTNNGKYYFLQTLINSGRITNAPDIDGYPLNVFSNSQLTTFYLFVLAVDTDHTKQIISVYGSNPKTHIIFTRTRFKNNNTHSWSEWVQVLTGKDIPVNRKTGGDIGTDSVALGRNGTSSGECSTTSGDNNIASGIGSVALGANNKIAGNHAAGLGIGNITDGDKCIAIGSQITINNSNKNNEVYGLRSISIGTANTCGVKNDTTKHGCIAVGRENENTGTNSVAVGYNNRISADYGFAIGNGNKNSGANSFTAGRENTASGTGSAAIGYNNTASGTGSVAMGYNNTSSGSYAITTGYNNTASGEGSAAIGYNNNSKNNKAYTFGEKNTVNSVDAFALGYNNTLNRNSSNNGVDGVDAYCSGAMGYQNTVNGYTSFALGAFNKTYSQGSLALGYTNTTGVENSADGKYAIAMGRSNTASGMGSVATGYSNTASGESSFATGYSNTASGEGSAATGYSNTVSRAYSFSTGKFNTCNAVASFISGYSNEIKNNQSSSGQPQYGYCSGAIGYHLINDSYTSLVIGKYNNNSVDKYTGGSSDGYLFAVGNGNSNSRSNAFRVNFSGLVYGGRYNTPGADYAEFIKPWYDNNVENEDRVGYMVTIKNGYLYKANDGDYIVGITSGNPSVIGNGDEDYYWKYERDEFNRIIYHEIDEIIEEEDNDGNIIYNKTGKKITVPKISSNYDSSLADSYIERKDRPEWSYVGMRGIIPVRDDGTCEAGGFCKCGSNGIATSSERGLDTYYVIERINDHVISVEVK